MTYPTTLATNLAAELTPRGVMLNALPVIVLVGATVLAWGELGWEGVWLFRPIDLALVLALIGVALVMTNLFQTGRIVMHSAPFFVVPMAEAVGRWARRAAA